MLLLLNKITLDAPVNLTGESLVLAELVLPRPAIARRSVLKPVRLSKGKRSLARAGFVPRALLKERVEGLFGLRVAVTRPLGHPEFSRFTRQILATGIESLPDFIPSTFSLSHLIEDLGDEVGDQLADRVLDGPDFIAQGSIDLDSASLVPGKLSIPLSLTESIRSSAHMKLSNKREKRKSAAKTFRKGMAIGEVVVEVIPE